MQKMKLLIFFLALAGAGMSIAELAMLGTISWPYYIFCLLILFAFWVMTDWGLLFRQIRRKKHKKKSPHRSRSNSL